MNQVATLPIISIEVGPNALDPEDTKNITEVCIRQKLSQPTLAEITITDPSDSFMDTISALSENSLTIAIEKTSLFHGHITAVECQYNPRNEKTIRIRGYDNLYAFRKKQTIRSHTDMSCVDIIKELAQAHGMQVDGSASAPVWPWVLQYRQSDFDFMKALAQRAGLYFYMREDKIYLISLEGRDVASVSLTYGIDLLEAVFECNNDRQFDEIDVSGWNPFAVTTHSAQRKKSGGSGDGKFDYVTDSSGSILKIRNIPLYDDEHAKSFSRAVMDRAEKSANTMIGVADGTPQLHPGLSIAVDNIHDSLKRNYLLTEVTHSIDSEKGYISRISTKLPQPVHHEQNVTVLPGEVTSVDDPEKLGRVKVSLLSCDNIETEWLSVLMPAAGNNKGIVALPDTGDRVGVLLISSDITFGLVLGGLYGAERQSPGWGVEDGSVKQYRFVTAGGQSILLDDVEGRIRLENSKGSYCDIGTDTIRLHAEADILMDAPGKKVTIRGRAIDFEKAG